MNQYSMDVKKKAKESLTFSNEFSKEQINQYEKRIAIEEMEFSKAYIEEKLKLNKKIKNTAGRKKINDFLKSIIFDLIRLLKDNNFLIIETLPLPEGKRHIIENNLVKTNQNQYLFIHEYLEDCGIIITDNSRSNSMKSDYIRRIAENNTK